MSSPDHLEHRVSLYKKYKQATSRLVFWLVNTSNSILHDLPSTRDTATPLPSRNTTGQIRPDDIISSSRLIADHSRVPPAICTLLSSIIRLRSQTADEYDRDLEQNPHDDALRQSNQRHRHFISILVAALEALGGQPACIPHAPHLEEGDDDEDVDDFLFRNFFEILKLEHTDADDEEASDYPPSPPSRIHSHTFKGKGKGKGKRRKNKPRKAVPHPPKTTGDEILNIPLEAYRIVHEDGLAVDYVLEVAALMQEAGQLRITIEDIWWEAAHHGRHTSIAAAVSETAVATIQTLEREILGNCRAGFDCYEKIVQTVTHGNLEWAQKSRHFSIFLENGREHHYTIDVKEQLCWHAYQDLVAFVVDYRQHRNGRPTDRMRKELEAWNPLLNLHNIKKKERLAYRRLYTINWLYDLVNVFASAPLRTKTKMALESIDWTKNSSPRRLFGLNKFAAFITSLAMQKEGTPFNHRIRPHHVFHLQFIVDAWTMYRGWSNSVYTGHVLEPLSSLAPIRDIDHFLDHEGLRGTAKRFCFGLELAHRACERRVGCKSPLDLMVRLRNDFRSWLGDSTSRNRQTGLPPSRFFKTNPNGFWEFSPYVSGLGAFEGLALSSELGLHLLDHLPELILFGHLQNMLFQEGYLAPTDCMLSEIIRCYPTAFFKDGSRPTSDYLQAFLGHVQVGSTSTLNTLSTTSPGTSGLGRPGALDIATCSNPRSRCFFKESDIVVELFKVDWDIDSLPPGRLLQTDKSCIAWCRGQETSSKLSQSLRDRMLNIGLDQKDVSGCEQRMELAIRKKAEAIGLTKLSHSSISKDTDNTARVEAYKTQGMSGLHLLDSHHTAGDDSKDNQGVNSKNLNHDSKVSDHGSDNTCNALLDLIERRPTGQSQALQDRVYEFFDRKGITIQENAKSPAQKRRKEDDIPLTERLDSAKVDLTSAITGMFPRLGFNYCRIASAVVSMFFEIERYLEAEKGLKPQRSRYQEGSPNLAIVAEALASTDREFLERLSQQVFKQLSGLHFYIYWDEARDFEASTTWKKRVNPELPPGWRDSCGVQ